ncbi:hypothetical protein DFH28DRAFT_1124790 [Melampsora americana]|nr:hypothetical protein DFH28DRAFT_1124790 [Melampsora americana]
MRFPAEARQRWTVSTDSELTSLNQQNLQRHNETITILNRTIELQTNHLHQIQSLNSIQSYSASSRVMTNSPNFTNQSHPSTLLVHQYHEFHLYKNEHDDVEAMKNIESKDKNHEPPGIDIGPFTLVTVLLSIIFIDSLHISNSIHHQTHSLPTPLSPTKDTPSSRRSLRCTTSSIQPLLKRPPPRWRRPNLDDEDQALKKRMMNRIHHRYLLMDHRF